ncbi:MAG: GNAT family N-acetyltransferase [Gemmatimonadota bacterium]
MSGLAIRPARPDDVPVILALIEALAEYEWMTDQCVATVEALDGTLFGDHPAAEVLLAEIDGAAVGFALFLHNYSTFLARRGIWLEDLFVRPEWRGHGIGRALLAHLARIAVTRDCGRLEWTVLDWNESAIGFYRRLGAVALDEWTTQRLSGEALFALSELAGS